MTVAAGYIQGEFGLAEALNAGWARPDLDLFSEPPLVSEGRSSTTAGEIAGSDSDDELLNQARAGSLQAFEALALRYRSVVTRLAARFLPNPEDAEDLTQDALIRAYSHLNQVKAGVPFRSWLMRITVNLCLDRLRYCRRRPEHVVSQVMSEDPHWVENRLFADAEDLHVRLESAREARELLHRVLPRLSPNDQTLLHLLYGEQLEVPEVAELMGWSAVNVRVRAFRARRSLKRVLEELLES